MMRRLNGGEGEGDLFQILLFWIAAYVSDFLAQITKLSPLLFYLVFGVCFSNFELIPHSEPVKVIAEVAITLVFFALGFEENVEHFIGGIKKAWGIATIGAFVPFCCGAGCAWFFWPDDGYKPAMMAGLAVTATAVSLTMITLKSKGLERSNAAIGIMTSAVLDDVMALVLVAIMVPIASGEAEASVAGIMFILGKTAAFFLMISFFHLVVFPHKVLGLGVNNLVKFHDGEQAVLVSIGIGMAMGLTATLFGFHPAIGAYMAGLILEKDYYDLPNAAAHAPGDSHEGNCYEHVKEILENAAFVWLGPIFFIQLGTEIKIDPKIVGNVIPQTLSIFITVFFGQIASAGLAAKYVPGGFSWAESLMIGFGMLGRAELFFVVLDICYNQHQIYSTEMFYSLTFAAVLLNICVPVTISLYTPYYLKATGSRSASQVHEPEIALTGAADARQSTEESGPVACWGKLPWRKRYDRRRGV